MTRISFFNLSPTDIRATPGLGAELRAHGITTLEMQCCRPLTNDESPMAYETGWDRDQGEQLTWCARNGFRIVARLDDAMRTVPEQEAMKRSRGKIRHVAWRLGQSGICDGVEVCDEMNPDPRMYPIQEFASWWKSAGGPPIACPGWAPQAYERMPWVTDYCSRQWPWWSATNHKMRFRAMKNALHDLPPDNRRVCFLIPVVGAWYSERDGKPGLSPGDVRWNRGMTPAGIEQMMKAARRIVAPREIQYRLYGYHGPLWEREIAEAKPGHRGRLQRGVSRALDPKRWYDILKVCKEMAA